MSTGSRSPLSSQSLSGSGKQLSGTRRRRRSAPKPKLTPTDSLVSPHLAMLENVTLQVSVDGDNQFVVTTQRGASTTSGTIIASQRHSFDELRQLKKKLLAVMQQGHFCHAECPWIYSYLKNYFPKKTSLTLSAEKRMAKRRNAIALCLTNVLQFVLDKRNQSCAVVTNELAQELACVLFGYDLSEYSVQLLTPVDFATRDAMDSFSSLSSLSESDDEELQTCQICKTHLQTHNHSSDDGDEDRKSVASPASSVTSRNRSLSYYTTTLGCGHQFHDECVLPVLNDTQRCPTCDHLEIQ